MDKNKRLIFGFLIALTAVTAFVLCEEFYLIREMAVFVICAAFASFLALNLWVLGVVSRAAVRNTAMWWRNRRILQTEASVSSELSGHAVGHARVSLLLLMLIGIAANAVPASAQSQGNSNSGTSTGNSSDPADQGLHVDIAPYLWFPGINGTVGALDHQSGVHVSAGDVLSNFDFGVMGLTEIRYNRIIVPIDFMWVKLSDNKGVPFDSGVESVDTKINEDIFTPKFGYRIVDKEKFKTDLLIGLRYWHVGTTLNLQPPPPVSRYYGALNWVDGVQGARFTALLAPKVVLTVAGDAGGGGARLDYQVVGLIGYKLKRVTLQAGWRYLVVHKNPTAGSFIELGMTGVVVGAVIPLK
jgi:hypothetical protein